MIISWEFWEESRRASELLLLYPQHLREFTDSILGQRVAAVHGPQSQVAIQSTGPDSQDQVSFLGEHWVPFLLVTLAFLPPFFSESFSPRSQCHPAPAHCALISSSIHFG
jgi:hypothetical protein